MINVDLWAPLHHDLQVHDCNLNYPDEIYEGKVYYEVEKQKQNITA